MLTYTGFFTSKAAKVKCCTLSIHLILQYYGFVRMVVIYIVSVSGNSIDGWVVYVVEM